MDAWNTPSAPEPLPRPTTIAAPDDEVVLEVVDDATTPRKKRVALPVILFLLTFASTFIAGGVGGMPSALTADPADLVREFVTAGLWFSVPVMIILLCHEMGHYLQAMRYGLPASLPYFIPFPLSPIGTMGAVIAMRGKMGDRKGMFDVAITGPIAGLIPSLICCVVGLQLSTVVPIDPKAEGISLGTPLLYDFLIQWLAPHYNEGMSLHLHPMAFAGWVGLFFTALNLFPVGQLDGGHILYALLRRKAYPVAVAVMYGSLVAMFVTQNFIYSPMLGLLALMGPQHPPTENDDVSLGATRTVLGWLMLAYVLIGFTPRPFELTG